MKKTGKGLSQNPILVFIYVVIAMAVIANIFVSGYWIGRAHEVIQNIAPVSAGAASPQR